MFGLERLFDFLLSRSREFFALQRKVNIMTATIKEVSDELAAVKAKVKENGATLRALVAKVLALEGNADPAAIDALLADAKAINAELTADEDEADDTAGTGTPAP